MKNEKTENQRLQKDVIDLHKLVAQLHQEALTAHLMLAQMLSERFHHVKEREDATTEAAEAESSG